MDGLAPKNKMAATGEERSCLI